MLLCLGISEQAALASRLDLGTWASSVFQNGQSCCKIGIRYPGVGIYKRAIRAFRHNLDTWAQVMGRSTGLQWGKII